MVQIICYILLITVKSSAARYVFIMFAFAGSQSFYPIIWPGMSSVLVACALPDVAIERIRAARGTTSAGLAIGITNGVGQLQGIVGPQIYQLKFGPSYHVSYSCSIGLISAVLVATCAAWYLVRHDDRKRREEDVDGSSHTGSGAAFENEKDMEKA